MVEHPVTTMISVQSLPFNNQTRATLQMLKHSTRDAHAKISASGTNFPSTRGWGPGTSLHHARSFNQPNNLTLLNWYSGVLPESRSSTAEAVSWQGLCWVVCRCLLSLVCLCSILLNAEHQTMKQHVPF